MNTLDLVIILVYTLGMLYLGYYFKKQETGQDYFLGGRKMGWFPLALSAAATQISAISFISAPAFVGLRQQGGMQWLTYEFGVPLAMALLLVFIAPAMYKSGVVSIYGLLEKRFDKSSRILIGLVFLISRAFATGVMVYTMALILQSALDIPFLYTVILTGFITLIYASQGGIKAVIYGDVIQMIILYVGILFCLGYGLHYLGGWDNFMANLDRTRLQVIDFNSFGFSNDEFGFWPMLFGGIVLYMSYYGCDQSQAQRILSASGMGTVRKTLLVNGLMRFPIVLTYCLMGLVLGTFAHQTPELMALVPADRPDNLIPMFILHYLPHGVIGLLVVAILAAAMSSLSSTINALSAVTVEDFIARGKKLPDKQYMFYSKSASLFWGVICLLASFFAGDIAKTVIEAINKIGSVFYGPILAMFIMAILMKRITTRAANIGLVSGVLINVYLWKMQPQIFWFWWNLIGLTSTISIAYALSFLLVKSKSEQALDYEAETASNIREVGILVAFFLIIFFFSLALPAWF